MDALLTFFAALFGKPENIAVAVLIAVNVGLGYLYWTERKENRVDRNALLDSLNKVTEALNGVKLALVALSGRVPL
jgi:peptidoglycan biosynthesis protein MviN/MurJ (putative lipid II flippase)